MKPLKLLLIILLSVNFSFANDFTEIKFKGGGVSIIPMDKFERESLLKVLAIEYPPFYKFWQDEPTFKKSQIKEFKEILTEYYRAYGYYRVQVNHIENNETLIFNIEKDEPIRVGSIDINLTNGFEKKVSFKKKSEFNTVEFKAIKDDIERELLINGYAKAELNAKALIDLDEYRISLKYSLDKGEINSFGATTIKGLKTIDEALIRDELIYEENKTFDIRKIEESYQNLYNLNAFSYISIESNIDVETKEIPIEIELKEALARVIKGSIGYGSDEGARGSIGWEHKNFYGNLKKFEIEAKANQIGYGIYNRFFIPKVDMAFNPSLENLISLDTKAYDGYDETKFSESLSLAKNIFGIKNSVGLKVEYSKIEAVEVGECFNANDGNYLINSLFYRVYLDKRDSKLNAKDGYLFEFNFEYSDELLGSEINFIKSIFEARYIKTINEFTFASKAKIGTISKEVPIFKRFFTGGSFTNRGYEYRGVGDRDCLNNPIGGNTLVDLSFEVRHPLYKELSGVVFFDSSILEEDAFKFNANSYDSIGFGFRYNTIIGPLRLDFGFPTDGGDFEFHFSIGQIF